MQQWYNQGEKSLLKQIDAGMLNASRKWTMLIQNWALTLFQLAIQFKGRMEQVVKF